jgi:membrane protease YdiL (CAAX protease family)
VQLSPAISAITVLALSNRTQLRLLMRSAAKWRAHAKWYAAILLLPFLTQGLAVAGYRALGHPLPSFGNWYVVPLLTLGLGVFSFGEELGWRGFYLANLLETTTPLLATLRVACIWGLWHLLFYLARHAPGEQTMAIYAIFMAGIIPVASLFTLIYLKTRSVLLCALFHGALNAGAAYWFGPLTVGANAVFGGWVAVLWVLSVPALYRLRCGERCVPDRD